MKRFLALWLLLAISLPGGLICQGTCANKNSMLEKLRGAGVTIYALPKPNSQYCSDEWKPNGTCCDPLSAGAAMKRKTDKNTQEVATMIREIESLPGALQAFQLKAELMMPYSSRGQTRQKMQKVVDYINSNKRNIQNSQSGCMKRLNSVTRASTCNICSGQSQRFFNGKKILMRQEDCRDIIDDCEQAWRSVVHILDLLDTYTTEVKKTYKGKLADEHFDSLQSMDKKHKLSQNFDKCPKMQQCDGETVSAICENLVSILTPSYAEFAANKIKKTKSKISALSKIGKFFKNIGKAVGKAAKAIGKGVKKIGKSIGKAFKKLKFGRRKKKNKGKKSGSKGSKAVAPAVAAKQIWSVAKKANPVKLLKKIGGKRRRKGRKLQFTGGSNAGAGLLSPRGPSNGSGDISVVGDNCPQCPSYNMGDSP